jgi:hypothetical protein
MPPSVAEPEFRRAWAGNSFAHNFPTAKDATRMWLTSAVLFAFPRGLARGNNEKCRRVLY